jgi:protein SCO1/2
MAPSGVQIGGDFHLTDHFGQPASRASFDGRYRLMFFGFTHCKAVCPRMLAKLSAVLARVDPRLARIVPLYVTVDPERDTPQVMRAFLEARFPAFLGLTGPREEIDAVKARFKVFAARKDGEGAQDYEVPHTALVYLMGSDGTHVAHFTDAVPEDDMVSRIEALLEPRA